jgi:VanZ family protein
MKLRYISWIPVLIIMCIIFFFSSKTAVESGESSLPIANTVVNVYETMNGELLDTNEKYEVLMSADHVIRKMAHCFEYVTLSISIGFLLWTWEFGRIKLAVLSVLFSGLYAATDEFHQLFVEGRSGLLTDVLIDTSGAVIGAVCFLLFLYLFRKHID